MDEEMKLFHDNHTWELVKKPVDAKLVSCKWVYKMKEGIPGVEHGKFKARLVARGFTQREGIDYNDVFSPIVKHRSIRILLAMVAKFDLKLEQMDVKTTFLYGELEEVIHVRQPEGYEANGKEDHVCKLNKSLYGLKQSPKQWNKIFDDFMSRIKFNKSKYDNCVYFKFITPNTFVFLLLYDDILLTSNDKSELTKVKVELKREFEMKDLGAASKILGIETKRDKNKKYLFLSQESYLKKVLDRFGMSRAKKVTLPIS